jgi:hypothetical protein
MLPRSGWLVKRISEHIDHGALTRQHDCLECGDLFIVQLVVNLYLLKSAQCQIDLLVICCKRCQAFNRVLCAAERL